MLHVLENSKYGCGTAATVANAANPAIAAGVAAPVTKSDVYRYSAPYLKLIAGDQSLCSLRARVTKAVAEADEKPNDAAA